MAEQVTKGSGVKQGRVHSGSHVNARLPVNRGLSDLSALVVDSDLLLLLLGPVRRVGDVQVR